MGGTRNVSHPQKHIHFVGIGGAGMSGIAEVLLKLGHKISGSDITESSTTQRLIALGIVVHRGHRPENIKGASCVVASAAINTNNPEIIAAKLENIPVLSRAIMLSKLLKNKIGIAVSGTHGKTTTTSLIASIFNAAGLDPTFVIGGKLNSLGSNANLGTGQYIIVEADESDASFLDLSPVMAIVTNIDADHMETYNGQMKNLKQAFFSFINKLPEKGVAFLCIDDENVRSMIPRITRPIITYGLHAEAEFRAVNISSQGTGMRFTVMRRDQENLSVSLSLPGEHNVLNALAAIAVASRAEISDKYTLSALRQFEGVNRRFQNHGEVFVLNKNGPVSFTLIDDYGHHPVEIKATLKAARNAFSDRRIILVFQPHRFTRTRDLFHQFVEVFSLADQLLLTDVYPAGESPIQAADGASLAQAVLQKSICKLIYLPEIEEIPKVLVQLIKHNDVVITMGAGPMDTVVQSLQMHSSQTKNLFA